MTIYLWEIPETYPDNQIGRYERERSPDRFLFEKGVFLNKEQVSTKPILKYGLSKDQLINYDCLINSATLPVVNNRVVDILTEIAGDDIQLFDVTIECKDGELTGYKLVNITHTIKAIDLEQSIYSIRQLPRGNTMIANIKRLVFRANCMDQHQLIRDEETGHQLASQAIYEAFKREKITGVWLATPDEFYDLVHGRV